MLLKTLIQDLKDLAESDPTLLDVEIVTAIDDEGNGFNKVYYSASIGHYDENEKQFISETNERFYDNKVNAICIN